MDNALWCLVHFLSKKIKMIRKVLILFSSKPKQIQNFRFLTKKIGPSSKEHRPNQYLSSKDYTFKVENILEDSLQGKTLLCDVNKLFLFISLLTMPSNVLPLHLKQTFPPIIWIFTEGEGDEIKSSLLFKQFYYKA